MVFATRKKPSDVKSRTKLSLSLISLATFGCTFYAAWLTDSYFEASINQYLENQNFKVGLSLQSSNSGRVIIPEISSQEPIKIAHAVSIIICKKAGTVRGMMDALAVLRHSIHQNSIHGNTNSKYSYQMYAFVHQENCNDPSIPPFLRKLGYIPIIKPSPVALSEIKNDWYRNHVESEMCCGKDEFLKLLAYNLTDHPVVVHWDIDVAVLQKMDDLYDAIIYGKDSPKGKAARSRIKLQRPNVQTMPDQIDAFITRDITSAKPWEKKQAVQGGFVVARPNKDHLNEYLKFIREGNYLPGRGDGSGWGVSTTCSLSSLSDYICSLFVIAHCRSFFNYRDLVTEDSKAQWHTRESWHTFTKSFTKVITWN
jgi:hypothetical protein